MGGCRGAGKRGSGTQGRGTTLEVAAAEPAVPNFPNILGKGVKKNQTKNHLKKKQRLGVVLSSLPSSSVFFSMDISCFHESKKVFLLEEGSSTRIFEAEDWNHWCCGFVQKCHLKQGCCRGWTVLQLEHEVNVGEGGKVSLWSFLWSEASRCSPVGLVCARAWEQLRPGRRGCVQIVGDTSRGKHSFVEIDVFYSNISLSAAE